MTSSLPVSFYKNNVFMLAERFFIQDESTTLKLHAHKYNFDIIFFSQIDPFIKAIASANDDDLFVVDLDVLHDLHAIKDKRNMFLQDLLKPLPDNRQYVYLETAKQGSRYLLQKMLLDTNCMAYAEKPFSSEDLVDNLFNLFAQRKRDDQGKILFHGTSVWLDESMLAEHNISLIRHDDYQTLHTQVKFSLPDVVVIDSESYKNAESIAEIIQKNIAADPSLEIVMLQTSNDNALSERGVKAGFDVVMMHQTNQITTAQLINRINKIRTNKNLISRDRATGLLNKVGYKKRAQERIYEADKAKTALAVVIFDIDKFKTINDTWGHHFGDVVIKRLSMYLGQFLEDKYLLSRFGGEEFVMLFWNADHDAVMRSLNDIREGFNQIEFEIAPGEIKRFSISGGVAFYPKHKTENALFLHADEALYRAKTGGRNQICE